MVVSAVSRRFRRLSEPLGVRLIPSLGVLAAVLGIILLQRAKTHGLSASAITAAPAAVHGSEVKGTLERLRVTLGDRVVVGQELALIRSVELEAERTELDALIQRTIRAGVLAQLETSRDQGEAALEALVRLSTAERDREKAAADRVLQARLAEDARGYLERVQDLARSGVIEERAVWLQQQTALLHASLETQAGTLLEAEQARAAALRRELSAELPSHSLLEATARFYETELDVLERRRHHLDDRAARLSVRARIDGVVTEVAAEGTTLREGDSLVRVVPERAVEVVAYVPSEGSPLALGANTPFAVRLSDGRRCEGSGKARSTAVAEQKPGQLMPVPSLVGHGFPVRVTLPDHCSLPVGQVVELQITTL